MKPLYSNATRIAYNFAVKCIFLYATCVKLSNLSQYRNFDVSLINKLKSVLWPSKGSPHLIDPFKYKKNMFWLRNYKKNPLRSYLEDGYEKPFDCTIIQ